MRKVSVFNILFLFIFSFLMLGFIDRITALFGESDHDRKFVPLYEFYNSLDYDYPEAKRGLINMNALVQNMLEINEAPAEFYVSKDREFKMDSIKTNKCFYDPSSDTLFYNLNQINFKDWENYKEIVLSLNLKRYRYLAGTNQTDLVVSTEDVKVKETTAIDYLKEMEESISVKGTGNIEVVDRWVEQYINSRKLNRFTTYAQELESALFLLEN